MKSKSMKLIPIVLLVYILLFALEANAGYLISGIQYLDSYPVNTKSGSQEIRFNSYKNAVAEAFPEIDKDALLVTNEQSDPRSGTRVRLQHKYRDMLVVHSYAFLRIDKDDNARIVRANFHDDIDLEYKSFLSMYDDSTKLDSLARIFWPEAADDPEIIVVPSVLPISDGSGGFTYHYALGVAPRHYLPHRYYDWGTGELLLMMGQDKDEVTVPVSISYYKNPSDPPVLDEVSPGIGKVGTYIPCPPPVGNLQYHELFVPQNGTVQGLQIPPGLDPYLLRLRGETGNVKVYRTGQVFDLETPFGTITATQIQWSSEFDLFQSIAVSEGPVLSIQNIGPWWDEDWDDPSCLYNLEFAARWHQNEFGYTRYCDAVTTLDAGDGNTAYTQRPIDVLIDAFDLPNSTVTFTRGDGWDYYARTRSTAWHEYSHVWQTQFYGEDHDGTANNPCSEWAWIKEGVAMFMPFALAEGEPLKDVTGWPEVSAWTLDTYNYDNLHNIDCEGGPYERARILTTALSHITSAIYIRGQVPNGWRNAWHYVGYLTESAIQYEPLTFVDFMTHIINEDALAADPSVLPLGNQKIIYEEGYLRSRIPISSASFDWYLDQPELGGDMQTDDRHAFGPSSSSNLAIQYGTDLTEAFGIYHTAFMDEGKLMYGRSMDEGQTWRVDVALRKDDAVTPHHSLISSVFDPMIGASNPAIAVHEYDPLFDHHAYGYIAYNVDDSGIGVIRGDLSTPEEEFPPRGHRSRFVVWEKIPQVSLPAGNTVTAPVVVANGLDVVVLAGVSAGPDMGLHCWQCTGTLQNTWNHTIVPGSESQSVTSVSAYMVNDRANLHVAWIGDGDVYYHEAIGEGILSWTNLNDGPVLISDEITHASNFTNVSVAFMYEHTPHDVRRPIVAWQGTNDTRGYDEIFTRWGWAGDPATWGYYWWYATDRHWSPCAHHRSPSLFGASQFLYNTTLPYVGDTRATIVFERLHEDYNPSVPWIFMQNLCAGNTVQDIDGWNHGNLGGLYVGKGYSPSAGPIIRRYDSGFEERQVVSLFLEKDVENPSADYVAKIGLRTPGCPRVSQSVIEEVVISGEKTFYAPFLLDSRVIIPGNATLRILPLDCDDDDAVVSSVPGGGIIVEPGGKLEILGTASNPIEMRSYDGASSWDGIELDGGQLKMDWVEVYDTGTNRSVVALNSVDLGGNYPVEITNCVFDGGGLLMGNNPKDALKLDNVTIRNVQNNEGLYLLNCYVNCIGVNVLDCTEINTYLKKVSGLFINCIFEGRTQKHGVFLNTETCNPTFSCCQFTNLAPTVASPKATVYSAIGCNPVFGKYQSTQAANVFFDDSEYLLAFAGAKGPLPLVDERPNDFYQLNTVTGKYMLWEKYPVPLQAPFRLSGLYWKSGFDIRFFEPEDINYWKFGGEASNPYGVCGSGQSSREPGPYAGGHGASLDEDSLIVDTLSYAIGLEQDELFAEAQSLYLYVIDNALDESTIWTAAARVVTTDVQLEDDGTWIPPMLTGLIDDYDNSYNAVLHGKRILANYYLNHEDYDTAIDICNELLADSLAFDDSIFVATDLIGIQIAAGLIDWEDGSLDGTFANAVPKDLQVTSLEQGIALERGLIDLIGTMDGDKTPSRNQTVPTEFALYQNYPNPFNPSTQIRYDLPEAIHVKINVYNTLGQFVTQLKDGVQAAGAYSVMWDGTSTNGVDVATGMYIFRMEAGSFTSTKKMLLLK